MKNKSTTPHLTPENLGQILCDSTGAGSSVQSDWSSVEAHVATCAECQQRLDRYSAEGSWWKKAADFLSQEEESIQLPKLSSDILCDDTLDHWDERQEQDALQSLTSQVALQPPSHPEMLGRLGEYDIEQVIGRGGMGVVYRGFDQQLNRPVAIKVLSPHLASNATARKRFAREARAAAAVVHPHVIPIHGVNSDERCPYIVMPLVIGKSLQGLVDTVGPLEVKDIVRISMQIAAGLEAAHKQGLVHRDIKPANILIEHDVSRVMITDFGLARAADDAAMTQTGWLAGTPHYMSPEQARGQGVDARSDLFSLGALMYFMATGRVPFRADKPVAVLNKICSAHPTPPHQINSDIPRTLSDIIEKLLEKNPADRFRSAGALYEVLERYLSHLQHPQSPRRAPRVSTRRRRRTMFWRTAASSVLVLAIAALPWAHRAWDQFGGAAESLEAAPAPAPLDLATPWNFPSMLSNDELQSKLRQLEIDLAAVNQALQRELFFVTHPPTDEQGESHRFGVLEIEVPEGAALVPATQPPGFNDGASAAIDAPPQPVPRHNRTR